jgi:hypothetical protein
MRLNALCLIGSLTALAILLPPGAVPAQQGQHPFSGAVKQPPPL